MAAGSERREFRNVEEKMGGRRSFASTREPHAAATQFDGYDRSLFSCVFHSPLVRSARSHRVSCFIFTTALLFIYSVPNDYPTSENHSTLRLLGEVFPVAPHQAFCRILRWNLHFNRAPGSSKAFAKLLRCSMQGTL